MPKVSIIIPFNNVEQYIKECLDSVVNQKLKDIEIICVDDASEDSSRKIVEEYAKQDNRIKIIDIKTRQGQGYARNRAMEIAQGEYIGFVDADDYIESDMFVELYAKAKLNDNDITICQAREYDDINEKFVLSDYYSLNVLSDIKDRVFSAKDVKDELLNINVVLWNKIYKKSYLEKIGEKFPEGYIYEDLPFFFATFLPAERIQILWKNFYIYRINRKNSTMQQFNNKILDRLDMVSLTYEKLKQFEFLSDIMDKIKGWIINDLFHRYTLLKENYQREFFFKMKKIFKNLDIDDIENPIWKKVYHFEGYLMVLNNDFETFNQSIFTKYLDIHMVEDRLNSKISTYEELNEKINKINFDISKNYEYTKNTYDKAVVNCEKLIEFYNDKTDEIREIAGDNSQKISELETNLCKEINEQKIQLSSFTEEKISEMNLYVSNEINNLRGKDDYNYNLLKDLIENTRQNIIYEQELKNTNFKEKISEINSFVNNEINNIREKNDNNYNFLNGVIKETKEELLQEQGTKNSTLDEKISSITSNINSEINGIYEENKNNYKSLKDLIENTAENTKQIISYEQGLKNSELDEKIDNAQRELKDQIQNNNYAINSKIDEQMAEEKRNFEYQLSEIKKQLESVIYEQKNYYENQINLLKDRIAELEKTPIQKLKEKIKKHK